MEKETKKVSADKPQKADKAEKALKKELGDLKGEIEKLKAEANDAIKDKNEEHDKYLRIMAEYDNYRKRAQKEKDAVYSDAYSDVIKAYLPMYDNLLRAAQFEDGEALSDGIKKIIAQFSEINEKLGITEFGCEGENFDPTKHEAVMHTEDPSLGENVIAKVFQKGYAIGEKVIRYAVVRVAN